MPFGNGKIKYVIHYHWTDRNYWYAQKLRVAATTRGNVKSGYSVSKNTYNVGSFTVPEFRTSSATITREVDYEGWWQYEVTSASFGGDYFTFVNMIELELEVQRSGVWETVDSVNFVIEHAGAVWPTEGASTGPANSSLPTMEVHLYTNPIVQAYRISQERGAGRTNAGCTECLCACELDAGLGSIDVNFGMGRSALVPRRGRLSLLSAYPHAALFDPEYLMFSPAEGYGAIQDEKTKRTLRYFAPDTVITGE